MKFKTKNLWACRLPFCSLWQLGRQSSHSYTAASRFPFSPSDASTILHPYEPPSLPLTRRRKRLSSDTAANTASLPGSHRSCNSTLLARASRNPLSLVALYPSCAGAAKSPPSLSLYSRCRHSQLLKACRDPSSSLYTTHCSFSSEILFSVCAFKGIAQRKMKEHREEWKEKGKRKRRMIGVSIPQWTFGK